VLGCALLVSCRVLARTLMIGSAAAKSVAHSSWNAVTSFCSTAADSSSSRPFSTSSSTLAFSWPMDSISSCNNRRVVVPAGQAEKTAQPAKPSPQPARPAPSLPPHLGFGFLLLHNDLFLLKVFLQVLNCARRLQGQQAFPLSWKGWQSGLSAACEAPLAPCKTTREQLGQLWLPEQPLPE